MIDRLTSLEKKVEQIEKRLIGLESGQTTKIRSKSNSNLQNKIIEKINEIGIQHLVILSLKIKPKQTKSEIETTIRSWNKPVGSWFRGGNFNKRLLKTGLIMKDGIGNSNDHQFSLTMRGLREAEKIVGKYEL